MVAANKDTGIVNIHGKQYMTVANRINSFREINPEWSIETQLISADSEKVVMKALIMDNDRVISTGYAEEVRGSSNINKTSALENAETSAVGRALAFYGMGGTEIASADEVAGAISQQNSQAAAEYLIAHNKAWNEHEESIHSIKAHLRSGNVSAAWEEYCEIPDEAKTALRVAATRGGCFTVAEGKLLKDGKEKDFVSKPTEENPDAGYFKTAAKSKS